MGREMTVTAHGRRPWPGARGLDCVVLIIADCISRSGPGVDGWTAGRQIATLFCALMMLLRYHTTNIIVRFVRQVALGASRWFWKWIPIIPRFNPEQ